MIYATVGSLSCPQDYVLRYSAIKTKSKMVSILKQWEYQYLCNERVKNFQIFIETFEDTLSLVVLP